MALMFQDIFPHVYHNEISWKQPEPEDAALCFGAGETLLCRIDEGRPVLPCIRAVPHGRMQYAFSIDSRAFYLAQEPVPALAGFSYESAAQLRTLPASAELMACAVGQSLQRWYASQKFCSRCGARMETSAVERAMVCPACHFTVYPKICPAVIAAVTNGDRLLLTRYKGRAFKKHALIAGFNEIGESIEDTVRREVLEEAGVRVRNLRFYKSQPWVFTDTLLMGFWCELDGSDAITIQEDELAEAAWVARGDITDEHNPLSLTGEMIERFRAGKEYEQAERKLAE